MPVRTAVAILVLTLSTVTVNGQTCPTAPPSPAISIVFSCSAVSSTVCDPTVPIRFEIVQPLQSCDVVTWTFGDGTTATTTGNEPVVHSFVQAGTFAVRADVANSLGTSVGTRNITVARGFFFLESSSINANESDGVARITVFRTSRAGNASVTLNVTNGTALNGADYVTDSSIVVPFAAGENSRVVSIPIVNNGLFHGDRTFNVELTSPENLYALDPDISKRTAQITILDDEIPTISFAQTETIVNENQGTMSIVINRTGAPTGSSTVNYEISSPLNELTPASGVIVFSANQTSKTLTLNIANDGIDSGDRLATITLRTPSRNTVLVGRANTISANIRIVEDDGPPRPVVESRSVFEGRIGERPMTFTIALPPGATQPATIRVRTVADANASANRDFVPLDTTITLTPGGGSKSVIVPIIGERLFEPDESFQLLLEPDLASGLATKSVRGIIRNDDAKFDPQSVHVPKGTVVPTPIIFGPLDKDGSVFLESENPAIATVPATAPFDGESGVVFIDVFGVNAGITFVNAVFPESISGGAAELLVFVYDPASLHFEDDPILAEAGTTVLAKLTMIPAPGVPVSVQVESSDPSVATVPTVISIAADGTAIVPVTAIANGSALISAILPELYGATFTTAEVVVGEIPEPEPPKSRRRAVRK